MLSTPAFNHTLVSLKIHFITYSPLKITVKSYICSANRDDASVCLTKFKSLFLFGSSCDHCYFRLQKVIDFNTYIVSIDISIW